MKKYLACGILLLIVLLACQKSENCPLQQYHIQCDYRDPDLFFPSIYITHTSDFYYEAHCPEEATDFANSISFTAGDSYKHCRVIR